MDRDIPGSLGKKRRDPLINGRKKGFGRSAPPMRREKKWNAVRTRKKKKKENLQPDAAGDAFRPIRSY